MFRIFQTQKKIDRNNLDGAQTREPKMKKLGLNLSEHYSIPITLALQFVSIKTKLGIFGVREFVTQNKIKKVLNDEGKRWKQRSKVKCLK